MTPAEFSEDIEERAAHWSAMLSGGNMTAESWNEMNAWLDQNPLHREAFEAYQAIATDTGKGLKTLAVEKRVVMLRPSVVRRRRRILGSGLMAAAAVVIGLSLWITHLRNQRFIQNIETLAAQRSTLTLTDGSTAEINARTKLQADFRNNRRVVILEQGEAYFSIVANPQDPFRVIVGGREIVVLGTQFNVRVNSDQSCEVTLIEGAVRIDEGATSRTLSPGQQSAREGVRVLAQSQIDSVLGWRHGRLELSGQTLREAVERFSAFHGKKITVAPEIANTQLGGSYPLDQSQLFLSALDSDTLRLRLISRGDGSFIVTPR